MEQRSPITHAQRLGEVERRAGWREEAAGWTGMGEAVGGIPEAGAVGRWGVGASVHVPASPVSVPGSHPVGIFVTKGQSDNWEDRLSTDEGATEKGVVNRVGGREGVGKQRGERQTDRETDRERQGRRDRGREERTDGGEGREGGQPPVRGVSPSRVPCPRVP